MHVYYFVYNTCIGYENFIGLWKTITAIFSTLRSYASRLITLSVMYECLNHQGNLKVPIVQIGCHPGTGSLKDSVYIYVWWQPCSRQTMMSWWEKESDAIFSTLRSYARRIITVSIMYDCLGHQGNLKRHQLCRLDDRTASLGDSVYIYVWIQANRT